MSELYIKKFYGFTKSLSSVYLSKYIYIYVCVYTYGYSYRFMMYFKDLGAGKSEICRTGQQVRNAGKNFCWNSSLKAIQSRVPYSLGEPQSFILNTFN